MSVARLDDWPKTSGIQQCQDNSQLSSLFSLLSVHNCPLSIQFGYEKKFMHFSVLSAANLHIAQTVNANLTTQIDGQTKIFSRIDRSTGKSNIYNSNVYRWDLYVVGQLRLGRIDGGMCEIARRRWEDFFSSSISTKNRSNLLLIEIY